MPGSFADSADWAVAPAAAQATKPDSGTTKNLLTSTDAVDRLSWQAAHTPSNGPITAPGQPPAAKFDLPSTSWKDATDESTPANNAWGSPRTSWASPAGPPPSRNNAPGPVPGVFRGLPQVAMSSASSNAKTPMKISNTGWASPQKTATNLSEPEGDFGKSSIKSAVLRTPEGNDLRGQRIARKTPPNVGRPMSAAQLQRIARKTLQRVRPPNVGRPMSNGWPDMNKKNQDQLHAPIDSNSAAGSQAEEVAEQALTIMRLEHDIGSYRLQVQGLEADKAALLAQRDSLRALERRHGVLRANHDQWKFKYKDLSKTHDSLKMEIEELKQKNISLKARHLELLSIEPKLTKIQEELKGSRAQNELQKAVVKQLSEEKDAMAKKLLIARTSAARAGSSTGAADTTTEADQDSTSNGGDVILHDAVAHAEMRDELSKLRKDHSDLQKSHAELTEQLADAEDKIEKQRAEIETGHACLQNANQKMMEISERRTQLQDTLLEVQRRYEQLAASRDGGGRLGREVSTSNELRMDKLSLENRVAGLRAELVRAKEEVRTNKSKHESVSKKLKTKLESAIASKEIALEKVKKLEDTVKHLELEKDADGMEMSPRPPMARKVRPEVPQGPDLWDRPPTAQDN